MKWVVVYKKSWLFHLEELGGDPKSHRDYALFCDAHDNNRQSLDKICQALSILGQKFETLGREGLSKAKLHNKAVISVGGDGTFLNAAQFVEGQVLIGVNSSPDHSVGALCATDTEGFENLLKKYLDGQIQTTQLARLKCTWGGATKFAFATNDILFCHKNPANMSRYRLSVDGREEEQRSSGIWVSTPQGSSAAMASAGGAAQAIGDKHYQFLVREPHHSSLNTHGINRGLLPLKNKIIITNEMADAALFIDGPHQKIEVPLGAQIEISGDGNPLNVLR